MGYGLKIKTEGMEMGLDDTAQKNKNATRAQLKPSEILFNAIVKWLLILGKNYRIEVVEGVPEIWAEAFKDLTASQFEACCAKHLQTGKFFPTVADIRGNIEAPIKDAGQLESERAWDKVLMISDRWGIDEETHEFIPIYSKGKLNYPPPLTTAEDYALRQIGWYQAIDRQDPEKMTWMRRDFIAAHKRFVETNGLQELPAASAGMLGAGAQPKLPPAMSSLGEILKHKM